MITTLSGNTQLHDNWHCKSHFHHRGRSPVSKWLKMRGCFWWWLWWRSAPGGKPGSYIHHWLDLWLLRCRCCQPSSPEYLHDISDTCWALHLFFEKMHTFFLQRTAGTARYSLKLWWFCWLWWWRWWSCWIPAALWARRPVSTPPSSRPLKKTLKDRCYDITHQVMISIHSFS